MIPNYWDLSATAVECPSTDWKGFGNELVILEVFRDLTEFGCPVCNRKLLNVSHPSPEETAAAAAAGNAEAERQLIGPATSTSAAITETTLSKVMSQFDRPVIQNDLRAMFVEEMVGVLLGSTWTAMGKDWGGWDFQRKRDGVRLEVKQSAARQSWGQDRASTASFDIAPRTARFEGQKWIDEAGRFADIYVFAWNPVFADSDGVDQRDPSQWQFVVALTVNLPAAQKSIRLAPLLEVAGARQSSWRTLGAVVSAVAREVPPRTAGASPEE